MTDPRTRCPECDRLTNVKAGVREWHRVDRVVDGVEVIAPCPGGAERVVKEET